MILNILALPFPSQDNKHPPVYSYSKAQINATCFGKLSEAQLLASSFVLLKHVYLYLQKCTTTYLPIFSNCLRLRNYDYFSVQVFPLIVSEICEDPFIIIIVLHLRVNVAFHNLLRLLSRSFVWYLHRRGSKDHIIKDMLNRASSACLPKFISQSNMGEMRSLPGQWNLDSQLEVFYQIKLDSRRGHSFRCYLLSGSACCFRIPSFLVYFLFNPA